MFADFAIGPAQVLAPGRAKHGTRGFGFGQPLVNRSVAPHFARRQVAQADAQTARRVMRDRPAKPDFEIVGVRTEHEQIDSHQRVNSNA